MQTISMQCPSFAWIMMWMWLTNVRTAKQHRIHTENVDVRAQPRRRRLGTFIVNVILDPRARYFIKEYCQLFWCGSICCLGLLDSSGQQFQQPFLGGHTLQKMFAMYSENSFWKKLCIKNCNFESFCFTYQLCVETVCYREEKRTNWNYLSSKSYTVKTPL